ncbi:hypothetical protein NIES593_08685 [Hydrococcus rivularis NIES-593]|uniref:Uncharacterized protein n=1 Tax=Hydrococcus rivularis NIES-593 TaxID=1921803 RepID=A0A1U7HJG9_9CYAN|nr:hypothetical protein [Hydrococcus rivularis]OKH23732.1 hypothetical protein NIES593_08685 [Hydrococcus rivularis NIES-593]
MESSVANLLQQTGLSQNSLTDKVEIHLVDKNDIFYKKGRLLAEEVYRKVWNTEHLIDGNDYAVVVSRQGSVVGNMNVQLRSEQKSLKSETFFGREHWQDYFFGAPTNVAELSALALDQELPSEIRRPIMMMLILGTQILSRALDIQFYVTIQHEFLMRILTKSLQLPFFRNENLTRPQGKLPSDNYWNREELPRLYYLDTKDGNAINTCASFFCYLHVSGIQTTFLPRIKKNNMSFSAFRKNWYLEQAIFN